MNAFKQRINDIGKINWQFWALTLVLFTQMLVLTSCSSTYVVSEYQLKHLIALKGNGKTVSFKPPQGYDVQVDTPYEGIQEHVKAIIENIKKERESNHKRKRIIIYVHGGLNGIEDSLEESGDLIRLIKRERQRDDDDLYYPIIVNWDSSIWSAYKDHLYRIRQGIEVKKWEGALTAPFYLFWDIGRGIIRYPITLSSQIIKGIRKVKEHTSQDLEEYNKEYFKPKPQPQPSQIVLGEDNGQISLWSKFSDGITYIFPGVLKLVTTPLLDAFGKPGWDNMVRRTQTVFRTPNEFKGDLEFLNFRTFFRLEDEKNPPHFTYEKDGGLSQRPTGGLSHLMEGLQELKNELKESSDYNPYEDDFKITLIGHSMGTIILNELIRLYGDSVYCDDIDRACLENKKTHNVQDEDFEIDEIVYLAAACTIRDFESSVIPYMKRHLGTRFYNVTLHPRADARELYKLDAAPRGSLLEWIDDFATNPSSFMELTLGKWNNAISAWHIIPVRIRDRVTLKGFGIEDRQFNLWGTSQSKIIPQKHGEINDKEQLFWKPAYWKDSGK